MRLLIQRVSHARVEVAGQVAGQIGPGCLVLVGVSRLSTEADAVHLAGKTARLRIFDDEDGQMNCSLLDVQGACLAVSQFTLYGDCQKGNRPSYIASAPAEAARPLYEKYVEHLRSLGIPVETGIFQAEMAVHLVNDGPVTLSLESEGRL